MEKTVKKAERFVIDDLDIREPSSISFKKKHMTAQDRTMSGKLVVDYIASKSTVSVVWNVLSNAEFEKLKKHIGLDDNIADAIESSADGKRDFYKIKFTDPGSKAVTEIEAYAEEIDYYPYFTSDGAIIWRDVSIEFSEV